MSVFSYRARDVNGLLVTGIMEGEATESIRRTLAEQGYIPISVKKGSSWFSDFKLSDLFKGIKPEELMLFTRQFHTLFKAGMDMESLLTTLSNQTKNEFFSDALTQIKSDVASGSSLAKAFAKHPKIFDNLYISMVATGEEAGILDEVLGRLSGLLEKDITLKSSVKSATLYPKIVVFVLIVASVVLMTVVVPKFASFYDHYQSELPLPTRIMMGVSTFFSEYSYIVAGIVAIGWFFFRRWKQSSRGRLLMDTLAWKIPVFGILGQKVANARFANILGSLYRAGIPFTRGLSIATKTIGNEAFTRDVEIVRLEVEKGRGIAEAMRQTKYLNPLVVEATAIGEKTGALDDLYASIGAHFDMEVNHMLKNLTTLIEPILLCFIFGMVTIFALAIFLPIWNMSRVVSGG